MITKEMICIVCPRGCRLSVSGYPVSGGAELSVTGNACPRGAAYGRSEAVNPVRVVTATCPVTGAKEMPFAADERPRRVPVKTDGGIPAGRVGELARLLHATSLELPVKAGDVVLENWEGTGVSVIVTRTIE